MPSHYTKREFEERERRRQKREQQPRQLELFTQPQPEVYMERVIEIDGHHARFRSWGHFTIQDWID